MVIIKHLVPERSQRGRSTEYGLSGIRYIREVLAAVQRRKLEGQVYGIRVIRGAVHQRRTGCDGGGNFGGGSSRTAREQRGGPVYGIRVIRGAVHQRSAGCDGGGNFGGPVAELRVWCWRRSAITRNP